MSEITPMMTALHYGHPTKERITAIDNMITEHFQHDTKRTICEAFYWYRKHSVPMENIDKMIAEIEKLRGCSCNNSDGIIDDVVDIIEEYCKENTDDTL